MRPPDKSSGALRSGASVKDKYEFIDAEYATAVTDTATTAPTIRQMCEWLGVSKSGFYEWRNNPGSATARRREELKLLITEAFEYSDGTYGYRRVHAQLRRWGVECGDEIVRGLMRELGLMPCQVRRRRSLTVRAAASGRILFSSGTGSRPSVSCSDRWAAAYTRSTRTMVIRSPSTSHSTR